MNIYFLFFFLLLLLFAKNVPLPETRSVHFLLLDCRNEPPIILREDTIARLQLVRSLVRVLDSPRLPYMSPIWVRESRQVPTSKSNRLVFQSVQGFLLSSISRAAKFPAVMRSRWRLSLHVKVLVDRLCHIPPANERVN